MVFFLPSARGMEIGKDWAIGVDGCGGDMVSATSGGDSRGVGGRRASFEEPDGVERCFVGQEGEEIYAGSGGQGTGIYIGEIARGGNIVVYR